MVIIWDSLGKEEWVQAVGGEVNKGLLYGNLQAPPHHAMRNVAVSTGRHAFFYSIYGDFPSHNRVSSDLEEEIRLNVFSPWQYLFSSFSIPSKNQPVLIVGRDFAWMRHRNISPGKEDRPVAPEDLGTTLMLAEGMLESRKEYGGRNVAIRDKWLPLATHTGEWQSADIMAVERMRYRGALVLGEEGAWRDGLFFDGKSVDELSSEELEKFSRFGMIYQVWWRNVLPCLRKVVPVPVPEVGRTFLTPNQWAASVVEIGLPYVPVSQYWRAGELQEALRNLSPPGLGGSWLVDIKKGGNYEVSFSLNAPGTDPLKQLAFKKGKAIMKMEKSVVEIDIMEKGTEVVVQVDFLEGEQAVEINVEGQGRDGATLSVPFVSLKYLGPRKTPVLTFPGQEK